MGLGFGLLSAQLRPGETDWTRAYDETVGLAVEAERLGFTSVWTTEHHFVDDGYMPSLLVVGAALAQATSRIELGTGVILAPMYHPLRLAEDAATVDLLSDGRLILGLGIGWRDEEFDAFGVPTSERGRRLEGTIAVLRQAWGDGLVTGDGDRFRYPEPGLNVTPKPVRGAASPIWIGAGAEPAVRRAGRVADGYLGSSASPAAIAQRAAWVRDEAAASGRDPATVDVGVHRMTFAWRGGDAWERVRDAAHYMRWKYEDMSEARGSIERRRPPVMESAAEAALRSRVIAGTPEEVADEIRAYAPTLGPEGSFVFRGHFPGLDPAIQREAFDTLVEEVAPLLRA